MRRKARSCRLFEGVQTKCMDALLNASKVELFMPKASGALRCKSHEVSSYLDACTRCSLHLKLSCACRC